uniref:Uncharacterized protein n=1 Tax=Anguilla anguilla TaxID=7936 RepID=A0A0E9TJ40_ANGAN
MNYKSLLLYSTFSEHSKCFTVMSGNSPHPPPMCSTHLGDARQPFCASPHISYITLARIWSYSVSDFHIKSQSKS